jgi:RimJ/RimL family protein N-acetyltransferase
VIEDGDTEVVCDCVTLRRDIVEYDAKGIRNMECLIRFTSRGRLFMRIYLRPITLEDGPKIVKWRNTPSVSAHCLNQKPITIESNETFFHEHVETGHYQQFIVERIDEDFGVSSYPIATAYLKDIDKTNMRCELCIFTSDNQEWNTESQTIAVKMLLQKAFDEMGIHKVYSYAFYRFINEASLLKKAGFTTEAILKEEVINENGEYDDIVRFAITAKEWTDVNKKDIENAWVSF